MRSDADRISFIGTLVVNIIVTTVIAYVLAIVLPSALVLQFPLWATALVPVAALLLACVILLYREFIGIKVTYVDYPELQHELDDLARRHRGLVRWVCYLSVWAHADEPEKRERYRLKMEGLERHRISSAWYIIDLSRAERDANADDQSSRDIARRHMSSLLETERLTQFRADRLYHVIAQSSPLRYMFGIYLRGEKNFKRSTLIVQVLDDTGETTGATVIRRPSREVTERFLELFNRYLKNAEKAMLNVHGLRPEDLPEDVKTAKVRDLFYSEVRRVLRESEAMAQGNRRDHV